MITPKTTPPVGATVRHPLWPELGNGCVESVSVSTIPGQRVGWVVWPCGQRSRHNLSVLKVVDQ